MKILTSLLFAFTLFMGPLSAMEGQKETDSVNIAGLKLEHVVLALWVNASGTTDGPTAQMYLLTTSKPCPTIERARDFMNSTGSYFEGRKMPVSLRSDTFSSYGYNRIHGPERAQKIVQALRGLVENGEPTWEAISKLYVSVWDVVVAAEGAQKTKLIQEGNFDGALALHTYYSVRSDADATGVLLAMGDFNPQQNSEIHEFAKGLAKRSAWRGTPSGMQETAPTSHATAPTAPTQAASPTQATPPAVPTNSPSITPPRGEASAPQEVLSAEFEKKMGPGLRKMFGGN